MSDAEKHRKIRFEYIKGSDYRTVKVDGIHGGPTVRGEIYAAVFTDRPAVPQVVSFLIDQNKLGDELKEERVGKETPIREVQMGMVMDLEIAKSIHEWLGVQIKSVEGLHDKTRREVNEAHGNDIG